MHGAVFPVLPFMLCFRQLMLALIYVSLKVNFERNEEEEKKTFYFAITCTMNVSYVVNRQNEITMYTNLMRGETDKQSCRLICYH